jgi:HAD superfamily hydrolase (TIGR01509 family)
MTNQNLKAVIFDWDGTLAATMPLHYKAYKKALAGYMEVKEIMIYLREGRKREEIIADLIGKDISDPDVAECSKEKDRIFRSLVKTDFTFYPGAMELIKHLKSRGLKLGLVTGTRRKNLHQVLKPEEISLFDCIIAADDVVNTKPDPEPFRVCLEAMRVKPSQAMVVENAPLGIQSAKSAGIPVIAITFTLPEDTLKQADFVVKSLADVEGLILERLET